MAIVFTQALREALTVTDRPEIAFETETFGRFMLAQHFRLHEGHEAQVELHGGFDTPGP